MTEPIRFECDPPIGPGAQRLLIVGGTFDPPHRAHVTLAQQAAEQTQCDWTIFIPAARSPHKDETPTPGDHRVAMLRLAIQDLDCASISDCELNSPPPNYTLDTLGAIREALGPHVELRLLMGSDQLRTFGRWHRPDEILKLATPVVVLRPPDDRASLRQHGIPEERLAWIIDTLLMDIDATSIRQRLRAGEDVEDQVDPAVGEYIGRYSLYQSPG